MTGRLNKRPIYVYVRTSQIHPDMTRYMSYSGVEETAKPEKVGASEGWSHDTPWMHRIQIGQMTYFMRPSIYNDNWERHAIERYASFGVVAKSCRYNGSHL